MNQEKHKIKVLYLTTKSNFGGAQRYVYDLATSLPKDSYDTMVAAGGDGILLEKLAHESVRTVRIKTLERDIGFVREIKAIIEIFRLIRKERPDVLHLSSPKAAGLGAFTGRLCGIPNIIQTVHGWSFNEDRFVLWKLAVYATQWITSLLCHKTIVISKHDYTQGQFMPLIEHKLYLIHNGIDDFLLLPREEARSALFSEDEKKNHAGDVWVLTNAELTSNKNLFEAIGAVKTHNNIAHTKIFYSIMGGGELKQRLGHYITKHKMENVVKLLGFVKDGRGYMSAFDVFFLPSKKEGLPYVLLEAGIAGLPVASSNVGGIPDIIENNRTGITVSPDNIGGLVSALALLTKNVKLRITLGKNLKKKVRESFSLHSMVEKTFALY